MQVTSYISYVVNEKRYHTVDSEKSTQDSGVSFEVETVCTINARDGTQVIKKCLLWGSKRNYCFYSKEIFLSQPCLLELKAPLKIYGDIHGQFPNLLRLFESGGYPPASNYLFVGDYVDRGKQDIETICLLLTYKIKYKDNLFLLRGNHECASINHIYGFFDECKRRLSIPMWKTFICCFLCMSFAALIGEKILCMHDGLSPELKNLDQIRDIARPVEAPKEGLLCDLLWANPDKDIEGWGKNGRGVSYTFVADIVIKFLEEHDIDCICHGHQVMEDGYQFFVGWQLMTIFSAPNYCGEFDNAAAIMSVDETLMCSFQIVKGCSFQIVEASKKEGKLFTVIFCNLI